MEFTGFHKIREKLKDFWEKNILPTSISRFIKINARQLFFYEITAGQKKNSLPTAASN